MNIEDEVNNQFIIIIVFCGVIPASYANSSFNLIISKSASENSIEYLASLLKLLKPQGRIAITTTNADQIVENLKLAGFVKTNVVNGGKFVSLEPFFCCSKYRFTYFWSTDVISEKPNYEVGSATKLSFGKKAENKQAIAAVWKLDDNDDDQEEINADDLLDEVDKIKPDPSTLKGTEIT